MAAAAKPAAVFEFSDAAASGPPLLGLWITTPLPAPPGPGMAFGAPGGTTEPAARTAGQPGEEPVWRASFPDTDSEQDQISSSLHQARARLWASHAALDAAPARLEAYLPPTAAQFPGVAYALPAPRVGLPQPERELSLLLATVGRQPPAGEVVSFGAEGLAVAERKVREAMRDFQSFAAHLQQMVAEFTRVETRVGGRLVGWTRVTWTGDLSTALADTLDADRIRLHQQTLALALGTRQTSLRIATLTIAAAAKLAATLATGVGVMRLVPLLFHYIEQLRVEFETLHRI